MPKNFIKLKDIFANFSGDPLSLHQKIEEFRLSKIIELTQDKLFVIDNILGYLAQLLIIEQWQALNPQEGLNRLNRFTMNH